MSGARRRTTRSGAGGLAAAQTLGGGVLWPFFKVVFLVFLVVAMRNLAQSCAQVAGVGLGSLHLFSGFFVLVAA